MSEFGAVDPRLSPMDAEEARWLTEVVSGDEKESRHELLELYEREAWKDLGYRSWPLFVRAELKVSPSRTYSLLRWARVERSLSTGKNDPVRTRTSLSRTDWIYVVQAGPDGPVKIGTSINPSRRFAQLQTTSAVRLIPIGVMPGGSDVESAIHRGITDLSPEARLSGEWFRPYEGILGYLREVTLPWRP